MNFVVLNPTYHGSTKIGTKNSKSLVELVEWTKENGCDELDVRRMEDDGSVRIKISFSYKKINNRYIRVK